MRLMVCIVTIAPIRAESSHKSEMVSQLLFGEFVEYLSENKEFIKIKCLFDGYSGWVQKSQLFNTDTVFEPIEYSTLHTSSLKIGDEIAILPFGTPLYSQIMHWGNLEIDYTSLLNKSKCTSTSNLLELVNQFLHTPYLWGGKSIFGIDCSGFVQQVFKVMGINLPRDAYQQAELGQTVAFLQQAQLGDLAFFENEEGKIIHVGIVLSDHTIIHASGEVRIDFLDYVGIIHKDTKARTHQLRIIKRILLK